MYKDKYKHEFSLSDAVRITRNLDPEAKEALVFVAFVQNTTLIFLKLLERVQSIPYMDSGHLVEVARSWQQVLSKMVLTSAGFSMDLGLRVRDILEAGLPRLK